MTHQYISIFIPNGKIIENWYHHLDELVKPILINYDDKTELRYDLSDCIISLDYEKVILIIINHCSILKYRCPTLELIKYDDTILRFDKKEITNDIIDSFLR